MNAPSPPPQVVILGAGRGVRGGVPSVIVDLGDGARVMDWLLDAFAALPDPEVCFVGGFKADEVVERYPAVRTVFNRDWSHTGPVRSLALAPLDPARATFVSYSDVVFRRAAVAAVSEADGDVVMAVDSRWRDRYDGRGQNDLDRAETVALRGRDVVAVGPGRHAPEGAAEFAGLLRLSGAGTTAALHAIRAGEIEPSATLPDLIRLLLDRGVAVTAVDLEGQWAELDAKQDLARFVLGTKAESLDRLSKMSHGGEIGALVSFTYGDWRTERSAMLDRIFATIEGDRLIVRSSALSEDSWHESAAGRYESILDVPRGVDEVARAVDQVFASYGSEDLDNQVLVQAMLRDVAMSGVVMTRTHALNAPYYVINFDDTTARTDTVTGGGDARTVFVHRHAELRDGLPAQLGPVLATVQNIEKLVGHDSLDIEFAVTGDGRVHILQVRPIAVTHTLEPIDDEQVWRALTEARQFVRARTTPLPTVVGSRTRYSVMSDWNPAEIIGTKPKQLAFSLYRHLITDDVWAQQRAEYGYRDVRPCPLLVDIVGHPYVDVRATFTSFVPAGLPDELATRLVDHSLDLLAAQPGLHDKVEFDILFTCLTVDFDALADQRLPASKFTPDEVGLLRDALRTITIDGMERLASDVALLSSLDERVRRVTDSSLPPIERAALHLETARRFGTLTFSHLARGAFVATSLLRSLQAVGAVAPDDLDAYLASIETVLGRMQAAGQRVKAGEESWDDFVTAYGHLRPGTYDITSPCYRVAAEAYLRPVVDRADARNAAHPFEWPDGTRAAVSSALDRVGLPADVDRFDEFARGAIAGREYGKFVFTKALSEALECIAEFGEANGLSRDELAHIRINDLLACRDVMSDRKAFLAARVLEGQEAFHIAQGVCLPGQIADDGDLVCFEQEAAEPNFVSQRTVEAPARAGDLTPDTQVDGAIVLIPNADPGYDWLLARDIAGLITMYGGANSHMAVRAAELSLPAAIGVGELLYLELEPASVIRLDCASRTIRKIH